MKPELVPHICTQQTTTNGKIRNSTTHKQRAFGNHKHHVFSDRLFFKRPAQRF